MGRVEGRKRGSANVEQGPACGSAGATRSAANLPTFNGLEEGFQHLLP